MALTPEQQQQIEDALYAEETHEGKLRAISRWNTEQLHEFMLRYNWDDGFEVPRAVLNHPGCERGTALFMLWAMGGPSADDSDECPLGARRSSSSPKLETDC